MRSSIALTMSLLQDEQTLSEIQHKTSWPFCQTRCEQGSFILLRGEATCLQTSQTRQRIRRPRFEPTNMVMRVWVRRDAADFPEQWKESGSQPGARKQERKFSDCICVYLITAALDPTSPIPSSDGGTALTDHDLSLTTRTIQILWVAAHNAQRRHVGELPGLR